MNIKKYIEAITGINLFSGFSKEELNKIFGSAQYVIKHYKKGQIIHLQNELCQTMDLILEGEVSVQNIDENGNALTINVFNARNVLGANLIFAKRNAYPMTVVSVSNSVVLHMHKQLILELSQSNTRFLTGLLTEISDRTLILTDKISAISLKTIRQCILDFLKYESHIQKTNVIRLEISKKELAERLGIQRTSLSRELSKMRKDGLVEYNTKTITLKNLDFAHKPKP